MNEQGFVDKRESDWQRLNNLTDRADSNIKRLSIDELRELIRLYRKVSTDLALARTKSTNIPLIAYLNDVAARSYGVLYRSPRRSLWRTLIEAVSMSAQTVRRNRWFVLTSALIFFGSAFFSFGLMGWAPDTRQYIIPPQMEDLVKNWQKGEFEQRSGGQSAMMTGLYASNNPKTSIITGAVGAGSFGIISVYLLFENGSILGGLAHEMNDVHKLPFLLSSISPHGVPELSGIVVSGSSGLLLAYALINPGRRKRSAALRAVGKDAIVLLATSVMLMFIAAPIEGFFSFQPTVPQEVKAIVAVVSVCAWGAFWWGFGREANPAPHPLAQEV